MASFQDVQAAIARVGASTSAEIRAVADKIASLGTAPAQTDIDAAVVSLTKTADTLDAETASLVGQAPPATASATPVIQPLKV